VAADAAGADTSSSSSWSDKNRLSTDDFGLGGATNSRCVGGAATDLTEGTGTGTGIVLPDEVGAGAGTATGTLPGIPRLGTTGAFDAAKFSAGGRSEGEVGELNGENEEDTSSDASKGALAESRLVGWGKTSGIEPCESC